MTAQTGLSEEVFYERFDKLLDAIASDDLVKAREIAGGIPLLPVLAQRMKHYMDKDEILELGYDMSLVEAELGKDWYDEP